MTSSESAATPRRLGATGTRRAMLDAAEILFSRRGYPATTITEIARHAGVGTNTVYVGFGNKPAILVALVERAADAESAREFDERVTRSASGSDVVDELARSTRVTHERFHKVVSVALDSAAADRAIDDAVRTAVEGYRGRLRNAVLRIEELGELSPSLALPEAVDLLWFYLGVPPWRTTIEMGWSWDRAEAFLAGEAKRAVLAHHLG